MQSGYFFKTMAVTSAIPPVVWGASTAESATLCFLRALSTPLTFNSKTRSDRWEITKLHFWDAVATGALTLVSFVPIYGTYKSYEAIFNMASNHAFNTWKIEELEQKKRTFEADGLYKELLSWEPDVEKIMQFALQAPQPIVNELELALEQYIQSLGGLQPLTTGTEYCKEVVSFSVQRKLKYNDFMQHYANVEKKLNSEKEIREEIKKTGEELRGTLINRSWIFTASFHLIDRSCRLLNLCAIRILRSLSFVFKIIASGRILRVVGNIFGFLINAANQEADCARKLVLQPRYMQFKKGPPSKTNDQRPTSDYSRLLPQDMFFEILEQTFPAKREMLRRKWTGQNNYVRNISTSNRIARAPSDGHAPDNAPRDYYHKVHYLPEACKRSKTADYILKELSYFSTIFPFLEDFDMQWLKQMPPAEKQKLIWDLSSKLPNLRTVHLDMKGIDPRWQLLIAVQLAKHAPHLSSVTFSNADGRTVTVMQRFAKQGCKVAS